MLHIYIYVDICISLSLTFTHIGVAYVEYQTKIPFHALPRKRILMPWLRTYIPRETVLEILRKVYDSENI